MNNDVPLGVLVAALTVPADSCAMFIFIAIIVLCMTGREKRDKMN